MPDYRTLTLVQDGQTCQAILQFEYAGYTDGLKTGWFALQSNGLFEATVLNELRGGKSGSFAATQY